MKNIKNKMKRMLYPGVLVLTTFFLGLGFAFPSLSVQASCLQSARLFGVTGDQIGSGAPKTPILFEFEFDQVKATPILPPSHFLTLGNGVEGEAIAFNPDDGLLYHLSGTGDLITDTIFERIDLDTFAITRIDGYQGLDEDPPNSTQSDVAVAFTYYPKTRGFLVVDNFGYLYGLDIFGKVTPIAKPDGSIAKLNHESKGLAFVGEKLYSIERRNSENRVPRLFEINPLTGETLSEAEISLTVEGIPIDLSGAGANGLATDPNGVLWGVLNLGVGFPGDRRLVTIDPTPDPDKNTVLANDIGSTGDAFASIAFVTTSIIPIDLDLRLTKAMVKFKHKHDNDELLVDDEFMVKGKFVLGGDSDGIYPFNECVSVSVGTSSIVIPRDSFEYGGPEIYKFKGTINGADVKMKIVRKDNDTYVFMAKGKGVDLTNISNPLFVELVIGDDGGGQSIRLKGVLNSWGKGKKRNQHHGDDGSSGHKNWKKSGKHQDDDDNSSDDD